MIPVCAGYEAAVLADLRSLDVVGHVVRIYINFRIPAGLAIAHDRDVEGLARDMPAITRPGHDLPRFRAALGIEFILLGLGAFRPGQHEGKAGGFHLFLKLFVPRHKRRHAILDIPAHGVTTTMTCAFFGEGTGTV